MKNDLITNTDKNLWEKSFRFGKVHIRFGVFRISKGSSFFIEKHKKRGEQIIIHQQIFQKINNGIKIRLAHHSRMQILKEHKKEIE